MTFGLSAAAVGLIGAGAVVAGSAISANAAENAADTQVQGTRDATAAQERMLERQIGLQEPWRQGGMAGLNALLQYTGLVSPGQVVGGQVPGQPAAAPAAALPAPAATPGGPPPGALSLEQFAQQNNMPLIPLMGMDQPTRAAYDQYLAGLPPAAAAGAPAAAGTLGAVGAAGQPMPMIAADKFGSLLKPFSMADFQADPGYAFRQQQGEAALGRAAQAGRGVGSGKYLKDAMRFNSGLASQEYGTAENRYRASQGDIFNRLASIAGIGQTATNAQTAATGAFGSQIGSNILGGANALASGQVGSANAINQGVGQGISLYQQNKMLDYYGQNRGVTPPNPYYGTPTVAAPQQQPMMDWYS